MLYDGNLRLDEAQPKLINLDFGIAELIRRNEVGELNNGRRVTGLAVNHITSFHDKLLKKRLLILSNSGDSFYAITNHDTETRGGFVFHNGELYYASGLISLNQDRDSFRQIPDMFKGTYFTDSPFEEEILSFERMNIPLFRTIGNREVFYDKASWPNGVIPNLGLMTYKEAFKEMKL